MRKGYKSNFMTEFEAIQVRLRQFVRERDWAQFHSPKNLAMALAVEAAELLERFQWLTEERSSQLSAVEKRAVGEEMADVFVYLLLLADRLNIDIVVESNHKISKNRRKYPAKLARGQATKSKGLKHRRRRKP